VALHLLKAKGVTLLLVVVVKLGSLIVPNNLIRVPMKLTSVVMAASFLIASPANAHPHGLEEISHEEASYMIFDINLYHYTSCLLNVRDNTRQLPAFGAANPTVLRDDEDNQYNIAIFSNAYIGKEANGDPISEICHAFLADNEGRLREALPEAKWLQASKCYGLRAPGYDYLPHNVSIIARTTSMKANAFGIRAHLNSSFVFSQAPLATFATKTLENVMLDSFHTHHAASDIEASFEAPPSDGYFIETLPYYGYFMRLYNHHPITVEVKPVSVALGDAFNRLFDSDLDASDLHTCLSFEQLAPPTDYSFKATIAAYFDQHLSPSEFYDSLNTDKFRSALMMDAQPLGNANLEDTIHDALKQYLHPFGAAGFEFSFMSKFRWVTVILDMMYLFLMGTQRYVNGKFPSSRFDSFRPVMILHILCGIVIIYLGSFLHIQNEVNKVSKSEDKEIARQVMYYILGGFTLCHSITVLFVLPKVMGERRITLPLYLSAGIVNMVNAIILIRDPTLKNAFLVWGSVNTFIYVRAYISFLMFADIDHELAYTYSIIAAASTTYPLTAQNSKIYYMLATPIVYGPFHEKFCKWFGWEQEDTIGGNVPSRKNVTELTVNLRTKVIDRRYRESISTKDKMGMNTVRTHGALSTLTD
jgi:hypothetical protein